MNEEDYAQAKKFQAKRVEKVHGVGLDLNKFVRATSEEKEKIRKGFKLWQDDIFAISVAQLIPRKNHIVLIRAVAELQNPHFHLFICGDGVQENELKAEAKKLGIRKQVHFLGFRKDVYKLCSSADLFLFASLQEGLPVAIMEAMACKLPIIASRIRGNTDLIDEGKGGYLVDAADVQGFVDAIQTTISDKEKLTEMEEYNYSKVQDYGEEEVLKEMSALYQSIM